MVRCAPWCHNLSMANHQLQGWSADPFGVHEERYISAGRPTKLVRDGNVEGYDEPPSDTYDVPDATAEAEGFAPGPAAAPGRSAGEAPLLGGVRDPYALGPGLDPGMPGRSRTPLVLAALAIVAGTIAGMVVLVKQSPASTAPSQAPATSAAAFLSRSAGRTLAERTADVTVSGSVQTGGQTITISGTGEIDFSTNAMSLDLNISVQIMSLTEKVIFVNGNLFVSLGGNPLVQGLMGGHGWIRMPASQSGSMNLAGSDPKSSLAALEQLGNSVRTLGTKIIDGVSCTGYAVTLNRQSMIKAVTEESAEHEYSSATTDQELTLVEHMSPPTVMVWLDAQGLVRQMSLNLGVQAGGLGGGATAANIAIDYTHFGAPVHITAPPASDTISYQSFLKATGANT